MSPSRNSPERNCFRSRRQNADIAESADLMTNVPGTLYHKWVGYVLYSLQYSYTLFSAVFNIGLSAASPKRQRLAEVMTAFVARMMAAFVLLRLTNKSNEGVFVTSSTYMDVVCIYDVICVFNVIRGGVTQRHFSYRVCQRSCHSFALWILRRPRLV